MNAHRPPKPQAAPVPRHEPRRDNLSTGRHRSLDRNDATSLARHGQSFLEKGQIEAACYFLFRATQSKPGDAALLNQLGYAHLRNRNAVAALRAFESALEASPGNALALNGIGMHHWFTGNLERAAEAFCSAAASEPQDVILQMNAADACTRIGAASRALGFIEHALEQGVRDPAMLTQCARCLRECGDAARALALLDRLSPGEQERPAILLETARCLRAAGRHAEAIVLLDRYHALIPDGPEYQEELGNCLPDAQQTGRRHSSWLAACEIMIRDGMFGRARTLLERLLAEDDRNAVAWYFLAVVQRARSDDRQAERSFRRSLEIDPGLLQAYSSLASLLEEHNRVDEARAIVDAGLQRSDGQSDAPGGVSDHLKVLFCRLARREGCLQAALNELDRLD